MVFTKSDGPQHGFLVSRDSRTLVARLCVDSRLRLVHTIRFSREAITFFHPERLLHGTPDGCAFVRDIGLPTIFEHNLIDSTGVCPAHHLS